MGIGNLRREKIVILFCSYKLLQFSVLIYQIIFIVLYPESLLVNNDISSRANLNNLYLPYSQIANTTPSMLVFFFYRNYIRLWHKSRSLNTNTNRTNLYQKIVVSFDNLLQLYFFNNLLVALNPIYYLQLIDQHFLRVHCFFV